MINKIKNFAETLATTDLFAVNCNVHADLDKDGNTERTSIDISFSYPRDEFVDVVDDEIDTGEEDFEECTGTPDDEELIKNLVTGALNEAADIAGARGKKCNIHEVNTPFMQGFFAEIPIKEKCCKEKCCKETDESDEAVEAAFDEVFGKMMENIRKMYSKNPDFAKYFDKTRHTNK